MKETSLTLPDIYRSQHVKRWHIVHTSRQQTVAEHSYMVTMISMVLVEKMEENMEEPFGAQEKMDIMKWSLMHDLPEVIMGDAVSPVKRLAKEEFDKIEKQVDPGLKRYEKGLSDKIKTVVKIADLIDALKYLKTEGMNGQAVSIYSRLYKDLVFLIREAKERWPSINWDMSRNVLAHSLHGSETYIDGII